MYEQQGNSSNNLHSILIVDDDASVRNTFVRFLENDTCTCRTACNGLEALEILKRSEFDLVISDLQMPGMDGMELLANILAAKQHPTVIVATAHGDIDGAVAATRLGAYDFLCKPIERKQLQMVVARAIEHQRLVVLNRKLQRQVAHSPTFGNLIGKSPAMLEVFRVIAQVAPTKTSVLITGESGTGKEQVARAIHNASDRSQKRFNVVDCASIPENLMESVLFGHKRGAFTGAEVDHAGILGASNGGTVFFDEIGELPLLLQAKLLRVLQERTILPVGGDNEIPIDIRVISATNRDLAAAVEAGTFRKDLFYRLNVIPIHLPPLRERDSDVEDLAFSFFDEISEQFPEVEGISQEAMEKLLAYPWPGNVRELRNVIERTLSLTTSDTIRAKDLPREVREANDHGKINFGASSETLETREAFLKSAEREYLSRLLILHGANITHAAKHAGVGRNTFYKLLKESGLDAEDFRTDNNRTR